MDTVALLRQLSEASGVTGYEEEVRALVAEAFRPHADEIRVDALGNLIALKRGTRPEGEPVRSIMLAAHTDEIGMMVTGLEEGFLRVGRVGGTDPRTILGQEVVVHGRRPLPGIIGSRPPHVLPPEARKNVVPFDELFVDVGLAPEALRELVRVGDVITLYQPFTELAEGYVAGKAFDDRAGVVSVALCLEALAAARHRWDVYAVATTQEEIGLRGATVSAWSVAPDAAIAIDVGFGRQRGVSDEDSVDMDGGPVLTIGPNVHPVMYEELVRAAKAHEIRYQVEVAPGATGTDGWAIQVARAGVPTEVISLPLRYMHSTVETVCVADIERTGRLMAAFIARLDESFSERLGLL
ncbi:MAG: M42 family metallopeptidase [Chloroflexi bacterium]|jgi:endoglucanase|nr:M42 family metallopeptidase [Chloroflexota bacterium]